MGKHTGPESNVWAEIVAYEHAVRGLSPALPLTGRHHLTCAPAIVKAQYHRWNASTERTHTRKEELSG